MDDVERGPNQQLDDKTFTDGYPAVASFLSRDPDSETYVFRKFNRLTARVLLYQQAELQSLENELDQLDYRIAHQDDIDLDIAMRSWKETQVMSAENPDIAKQVQLTMLVQRKLKQYHDNLLCQSNIARLEVPSSRLLSALRREIHGQSGVPGPDSLLAEPDRSILDDRADLVALKPPAQRDLLFRTIRDHWPLEPTEVPEGARGLTWHFEERKIVKVAGIVSTGVAVILLLGSILLLFWVTDRYARLGLVLGFIMLFAVGLKVCTGASRDQIFGATAAYAAVLIVFVSGNLGNTDGGSLD